MLLLTLSACLSTDSAPPQATPPATQPAAAPAPAAEAARAAAPPIAVGTPLAALVATSGNALPLMDGDLSTSWRPNGHHADEGVLLRFESPTAISGFRAKTCGKGIADFILYLDGIEQSRFAMGEEDGVPELENRTVRSAFLKIERWGEGACLGEIEVVGAAVSPPRTVFATISASTTLAPVAAYRPHYLFDSRLDFGWVEGAKGLGVGESISAKLQRPVEVHAVELWNGYQRSADHFAKNARAKRVAVTIGDTRVELDVPDQMGPSKLSLPTPLTGETVAIEILEATAGTRYEDLVLSEARVWDATGPLVIKEGNTKRMAFGLLTMARGTAIERLVDYSLKSVCAYETSQLKLRSNSSFVYYSQDQEASAVFDGAWVIKGPSKAGTQLQLYGRRHHIVEDWSPYGTGESEDTVRIAGGKPVFTRATALDAAAFAPIANRIRKVHPDCALDLEDLKSKDAVLVEGRSITDVFVKDSSRG